MKLKTPYKTVMFYGNVLRINARANWLAVNEDGTMRVFMEEPHISYGGWDVKSGAIWNLDTRMELEGEDWKDTLTYCPHDQKWMIQVGALLSAAFNDTAPLAPCSMTEQLTDIIAARMNKDVEDIDARHDAFHAFLTHGFPAFMRTCRVVDILRDKLFPKPEEREYRVVKDYYGRDVIVPPQARWIAMDINGSTYTYETAPVRRGGCWRENINGEEEHIPVSWYPPEVARLHWQDSLREVQP